MEMGQGGMRMAIKSRGIMSFLSNRQQLLLPTSWAYQPEGYLLTAALATCLGAVSVNSVRECCSVLHFLRHMPKRSDCGPAKP